MNSGIYQIRNVINSKRYVGSAILFTDRKNLHFSQLRRGIHHSEILQRAYNKYGEDNLAFEVIEECTKEELILREQYYINVLLPEYNICKIAGSSIGRPSARKKAVDQYTVEGQFVKTWESLQDIMVVLNLSSSSKISEVCKNYRIRAYNHVWRYKGEPFVLLKGFSRFKAVAEVNSNGEILTAWESIKSCAKDLNTTSAIICRILSPKDRQKTLSGRLFKRLTIQQYRHILETSLDFGH